MPIDFPTGLGVTGDVLVLTHQDPDTDANTVLEIDKAWSVTATWFVDGPLAYLLKGADWHLKVLIESMGGGEEKILADEMVPGTSNKPKPPATHDLEYEWTINIPARGPAAPPAKTVNDEGKSDRSHVVL